MKKIYGVTHSLYFHLYGLVPMRYAQVKPSQELLNNLAEFPPGSRIGIEWLSPEDKDILEEKRVISRWSSDAFKYNDNFWNMIIQHCTEKGHEVVYLEDIDMWEKNVDPYMKYKEVRSKLNELVHEKDESDFDYHMKLSSYNEELRTAKILARKISDIERDTGFLFTIASSNLDSAVVGRGHSDQWIHERDRIKQEFGIEFGDYSVDKLSTYRTSHTVRFVPDAVPDKSILQEIYCLRKALNLIYTGRLGTERPDYVGTWDVIDPSSGYFEMFIDHEQSDIKNGRLKGAIEDCLGTAVFEGEITDNGFEFIKKYTEAVGEVKKPTLVYKGERNMDCFMGFFNYNQEKYKSRLNAFILIKSSQERPLNLARFWAKTYMPENTKNHQEPLFDMFL